MFPTSDGPWPRPEILWRAPDRLFDDRLQIFTLDSSGLPAVQSLNVALAAADSDAGAAA